MAVRLKRTRAGIFTLLGGFTVIAIGGCANVGTGDERSDVPRSTAVGSAHTQKADGAGNELACTAIRVPISVVQNAATLRGADISVVAAQGMLLSSERQFRNATETADSDLAAMIDEVAEATIELARSDDVGRATRAEAVSALQADVMDACERIGVVIHFDAWVGG